jgi:hypothetical protein
LIFRYKQLDFQIVTPNVNDPRWQWRFDSITTAYVISFACIELLLCLSKSLL